jgi:hypothetical protein
MEFIQHLRNLVSYFIQLRCFLARHYKAVAGDEYNMVWNKIDIADFGLEIFFNPKSAIANFKSLIRLFGGKE